MSNFAIERLDPWGEDLHRPECVVADAAGGVFVSDWRGGVTRIGPDGGHWSCLPQPGAFALKPNGFALEGDSGFLVAHLGDDSGGVWRLGRDGSVRPVLQQVDGIEVPPTNFVARDARDRLWVSVSTRHHPRQRAWRPDVADGFVVLVEDGAARIVADGLHYTNEVRVDPTGHWLYAIETFGRRLIRFPLRADGGLGSAETVVKWGDGTFPDGFAFDERGAIWITSLVSNRLWRWSGDALDIVFEEVNEAFVAEAEAAFAAGRMAAAHLGPIPGTRLQHATSVAFGGPAGRNGFLGTLHGSCIYRFDVPGLHHSIGSP
jgi:sugar lactone lactonase YvrE